MDLSSSYSTDTTIAGCFLGVGKRFVWDRDLVCVSGGCMVWNSIISLFMPHLKLCLEWYSLYYILSYIWYLCTTSVGRSSVGIATDYGLDGPGSNPGGDEIFRPSRPALGPTQPPVK